MWDAEESQNLTANLGKTHSTTDTTTKCQFYCNTGYTWNASSSTCAANQYNCTGPTPSNASLWDNEERNGLLVDTPKTYGATDDPNIKCQYTCDPGFNWNAGNSTCVVVATATPITYNCTGPTPSNASLWDNEERNGLLVDTPKTYGATDDPNIKCQYHCDPGYTWNNITSSCEIIYNCTGPTPSNASMWDIEESTGLAADTPKTHSATDTAIKCQYHCDPDFVWDGNSCEVSYNVSGSVFVDRNRNQIKDNGEPNHSGTINIQSTEGNVTINNGTFQVRGILAGQLTISYTSPLPAGFEMIYPLNGPPPAFLVTVGPGCTVDQTTGANCNASDDIINLNFAITDSIPWIQGRGMDMRIDKGFTNYVANNPSCTGAFTSVQSSTADAGIIFTGDGQAAFGQGQSSQKDWVVGGNSYPEVFKTTNSRLSTSHAYIQTTIERAGTQIKNLSSECHPNLSNCTLTANLPSGVYRANNDTALNAYTFPNDRNYIFLISGILTLRGEIKVPSSSTALFTTTDDIVIDSSVGSAPSCSTSSNLEGFFSADNDVIVEGTNDCTVSADRMLTIQGAVFVNAQMSGGVFENNRNLCDDNYNYPSITFTGRPDLILNAPNILKVKNYKFQEEAP